MRHLEINSSYGLVSFGRNETPLRGKSGKYCHFPRVRIKAKESRLSCVEWCKLGKVEMITYEKPPRRRMSARGRFQMQLWRISFNKGISPASERKAWCGERDEFVSLRGGDDGDGRRLRDGDVLRHLRGGDGVRDALPSPRASLRAHGGRGGTYRSSRRFRGVSP